MTSQTAIIGFRKDRIAARLVGLLNVIRLGQTFGVPARFLWLSQPDGPYPELSDPREFLDPNFVARHIDIVTRPPDLSGRVGLAAPAPGIDQAQLRQRLAGGTLLHSDVAFDVLSLIGETASEVQAQIARIAAELPLIPRLQQALDRGRARLSQQGGAIGNVPALHLRRGDLLTGDPRSLTSWPTKYVSDEYCRAWAAAQDATVVVFTDTPAATLHMAQGDPQILPIDELLDLDDLRPAERDLLDLLLMASCGRIGAPAGSAFSRAASVIGQVRLEALPDALPEPVRRAADDALLVRVMDRPDSFLSPGDLAQSAQYAADHAIASGRAGTLALVLAGRKPLIAAHPFVARLIAICALSAGDEVLARKAARQGLDDPRMMPDDRQRCQQVLDALAAQLDPDAAETADAFLLGLFAARAGDDPMRDRLAGLLLGYDGPASQALMHGPALVQLLANWTPSGAPPFWSYLSDWEELLDDEQARQPLREALDLPGKLRLIGPEGRQIDADLGDNRQPSAPDSDLVIERIGLTGAMLSLHGRYTRALRLLHWLDGVRPDDALTRKRLADTCFRIGNGELGMKFLTSALRLAEDSPLLHLSMARRAAGLGYAAQALDHLERAKTLWPGDKLTGYQGARIWGVLAAE